MNARPVLRRLAARTAVFLMVLYAAWCAALFFAQGSLIYPRSMAGPALKDSERPPDAEPWWITADDGSRVEAWFVRGEGVTDQAPGPCVIWLHGNGELIEHNMQAARMYSAMGVSTLLPEYRGYGRSAGTPGQEAILADLEAFRAMLLDRPDVDGARIVYHGESLGTGFAAALAARHAPRAMVLNSAFISMVRMAERYLVPGFLLRTPLRSDEVLTRATWPVLMFHGRHDQVVPYEHGRALALVTPGAEFVELDCGHNNLPPDWGAYAGSIRTFLERSGVLSAPAAASP